MEHSEAEPSCQQCSIVTCQPYLIPTPSPACAFIPRVNGRVTSQRGYFRQGKPRKFFQELGTGILVSKNHSFLYLMSGSVLGSQGRANVSPTWSTQVSTGDGHLPGGLRAAKGVESFLGDGCAQYVGLSPLHSPPSLQLKVPGALTHLQASLRWQPSAKAA